MASLLDGFTSFNFEEGVPYVSITKNGVTFNKAVVMKLNYPEYVVLLINTSKQQIAIKSCKKNDTNSVTFYKERESSKVLSVRWNGKDLLNTLQEMTGWNLDKEAYRSNGILLKEEGAILFDLAKATLLK